MRPIKFRVWDKEEYRLIQGDIYISQNGTICEYQGGRNIPIETFEVMQFTGLLDKNGKEIYEGDILQWDEKHTAKWDKHRDFLHTYQCVFDVGSFFLRSLDKYPKHESKFWNHITQDCEVIGNIYENPDLISNK